MTRSLFLKLLSLAGALVPLLPCGSAAKTGILYTTEFENFCVGPDFWVGFEDWVGNSTGVGAHGIDNDQSAGFGKTAFLGFQQPASRLVTVAHPVNNDPQNGGSTLIEIETLIGLEDSKNDHYDNFFLSFYNSDGNFLAALQFSNERGTSLGIWRDDGTTLHDTGVDFVHGQLYRFVLSIDLAQNTWSASLYISPTEGAPLFTDAPFTATAHSLSLGSLAYEWFITSPTTNPVGLYTEAGDNWMLVADCTVWAIPPALEPLVLTPPSFNPGRSPSFTFTGEPGWTYQIEYADELSQWKNDLPGSTFVVTGASQSLSFDDPTPTPPSFRYYRLTREVTP
ncbi:MAG: hypothetical protein ACSHYF_18105 [Verrucomicrobiaceae bacterium]